MVFVYDDPAVQSNITNAGTRNAFVFFIHLEHMPYKSSTWYLILFHICRCAVFITVFVCCILCFNSLIVPGPGHITITINNSANHEKDDVYCGYWENRLSFLSLPLPSFPLPLSSSWHLSSFFALLYPTPSLHIYPFSLSRASHGPYSPWKPWKIIAVMEFGQKRKLQKMSWKHSHDYDRLPVVFSKYIFKNALTHCLNNM